MNNDTLKLAAEFPAADHEAWMALVEKVLKGADFSRTLVTQTYDGLAIQPLYTDNGSNRAAPGEFPYTRSTRAAGNATDGWGIAQRYAHPDVKHSNQLILEDLARGVTHLRLTMPRAMRLGSSDPLNAASDGHGVEVYDTAGLDRLLDGVQLPLVSVDLDAGAAFLEYASALTGLWTKRGDDLTQMRGCFNADPAAVLSVAGKLPASLADMTARMVALAKYTSGTLPGMRAVGVSTLPAHNAGASHSQEIAIALATGVSYLRAMTEAGLSVDQACAQIRFTVSTDTDYFQSMAKLRGLRQLWADVCRHCGASDEAAKISLQVVASERMQSQRDPWVNMLRNTIAVSAAAIGGADSVLAGCFDGALGQPSKLGRRISRNTQLLLQEESALHRVVDPAGGSYFIESLTDELSDAAWSLFQSIEGKGGIFEALTSGWLQSEIAAVREKRFADIGKRKKPLTGVSEFAFLDESPVETDPADAQAARQSATQALSSDAISADASDIAGLIKLSSDGAATTALAAALAGEGPHAEPLLSERLASRYESLRDASDAWLDQHGKRPAVFLVTIGKPAQFNARAGFVRNFFAAGGIATLGGEVSSDPAGAAQAAAASGSPVAVLCSTDALYEEQGADYIKALREAGIDQVYIAGKALQDQVNTALYIGCNTLDILKSTHALLKVS
ncbi:methylmalonyl-CoA mutase family protein [Granulosicoccaceae sp. 1_MG-2023]|nr:methylmalonyl-CoA mutase family protein [Granulosicoccaceae sp. 1_MG-2023]